MAVSVDRVYQTVLALANKEQRGYITPQEFNLFANHAQNSIFEQYFYDLNQFRRMPGNSTVTSDPRDIVEEKLGLFKVYPTTYNASPGNSTGDVLIPIDLYRLESVSVCYKDYQIGVYSAVGGSDVYKTAEELSTKEIALYESAKLAAWSKKRPVFVRHNPASDRIKVFPYPEVDVDTIKLSYIRKPNPPNWTYIIVDGTALANPSADAGHKDFELHPSEEKNLVIQILKLAGVAMKDFNIAQLAGQEEAKNIQQEKS